MTQLRAFVCHSFTPDDENVVRAFLKLFDHVKDMNPGFSWDHAELAEPKDLAAKVLGLIEGKNLFIGICTRKEAVVNLTQNATSKKGLKINEDQLIWKTSDWIIQEIGLAIGRKMDLILLIEDGIRQPGGLQGNHEYVSFDRQNPEKAFGKILEMIKSLMPRAKTVSEQETSVPSSTEQEATHDKKKGDESLQPGRDWLRPDFEFAMFQMIATDDTDGAKRISEAYLATEDGTIPENRASWEAHQEYTRLLFGKGGELTKLEELARAHKGNALVQRYLAKGYLEYKENDKAAHCFEVAAKAASSPKLALFYQKEAAVAYARASRKEDVTRLVVSMKEAVSHIEGGGELFLVRTLRDLAEINEYKDLFFGLTEKLLQLNPSDNTARFSLAYSYGLEGHYDLSLYHYLRIPSQERGPEVWNNLGVAFSDLDVQGKSVSAYKKADTLGNTLAMSNLAHKMIRAGFIQEAEEVCDRAIKIKDYHKNIGQAITRIKEIADDEDKKENEIIEKTIPTIEFYKAFGNAATKTVPSPPSGKWKGPDCDLTITFNG